MKHLNLGILLVVLSACGNGDGDGGGPSGTGGMMDTDDMMDVDGTMNPTDNRAPVTTDPAPLGPCGGGCSAGYTCVNDACITETPPQENGATCSHGSECASDLCASNMVGEGLCYGTAGANDFCGDVYDCMGGVCVSKTLTGSQGVCIPGIGECQGRSVSEECTESTVAFCRLVQTCDSPGNGSIPTSYADFDFCVASECTGVTLSPLECFNITNAIFDGSAPCP